MKHRIYAKQFMRKIIPAVALTLILTGCGNKPDPVSPGESYLAMLESRDVAEMMNEIREAKAEAETAQLGQKEPAEETGTFSEESEGTKESEGAKESEDPKESEGPGESDDPPERENDPAAKGMEELLSELKTEVERGEARELTPEELGRIKRSLSETVLIGDSMAQAALEYGMMEESQVFFQRGGITRELGPVTEKALGMVPENVIFFTGLNDADHETYDSYPEAYAERVAQVRAALPNARIWICSMTPPSDSLGAVREDLARAPVFDQVLETWCAGSPDATYIDLKWMVRQDWYMDDGIHFKKSFYSVWLRYIDGLVESAE